jgi:5,6,7,8-tetrahydromethanopterin hydro-lyase
MQLGEAFVGSGAEAAHVNVVLGDRLGPAGTAWATALATPTAGHIPFVVVATPGMPVQPYTLFVNKATIASDQHARLTWGAAQAGVAAGVLDALRDDVVTMAGDLVLIAAVWVDPAAAGEELVFANNTEATYQALIVATNGLPFEDDLLALRNEIRNPFFRTAT